MKIYPNVEVGTPKYTLGFKGLKKKTVQWRLGISLQSATRQELILFYVITFDLQVIKTQIGFHSKA